MIGKKVIIHFEVGSRHRGEFTGKIVQDCGLGSYWVKVSSWQAKMLAAAGVSVVGNKAFLWLDEFKVVEG